VVAVTPYTNPMAGNVIAANSSTFSQLLTINGSTGIVTWAQNVTAPQLSFNTTTHTVSATGTLATGTYTISGTTTDSNGETGTWSYSLTVS